MLTLLSLCLAVTNERTLPNLRETQLLKTWQVAIGPQVNGSLPTSGWQPAVVPKLLEVPRDNGGVSVWYRTKLSIPATWTGRRVFLDLHGVLYAPEVYLDGKRVAFELDGWNPTLVELTGKVIAGKSHEVVVRGQSDTAILADGYVPKDTSDQALQGKLIAPIGGYKGQQGFFDAVRLLSTPKMRIATNEATVRTSVRKKTIRISGRVDGANSGWIAATAIDRQGKRRELGTSRVGAGGEWSLQHPWADPKLWSPESPYLYTLQLEYRAAKTGSVVDRSSIRFGFKEVWTDGPKFYLNGIPRTILATSTWPGLPPLTRDEIRKRLRDVKRTGAMAFRLHIGPWPEDFLSIADEEGVLIIPEAPVYTDGAGMYAYTNPLFWQNYRTHVARMIQRDRNHACVLMWSLGNEILFMGNQKYDADLPKKLGEIGRFAKSLDSDHPITFEADLDPDGAFDVIGLHYPHELPDQHAYPVNVDWLNAEKLTEAGGGMLGNTRSSFTWNRKKPLYIGEYLWVPHQDFSPGTVFFGDDAYRNRDLYNTRAKGRSWMDQTIGYRRAGVSGLSPWTAMDFGMAPGDPDLVQAQQFAYKKVGAYLKNRGLRVYPGQASTFEFDLFNDSAEVANVELRFREGGRLMSKAGTRLRPTDHSVVNLTGTAPDKVGPWPLTYELVANGKVVDSGPITASVRPKTLDTTVRRKVLRYEPGAFDFKQLETAKVNEVMLQIPPHTLDPALPPDAAGMDLVGATKFDTERFVDFVQRGGYVLVQEQNDLSALGLGVKLTDYASTMTFPINPNDRLFSGLTSDDLKFWGKDMIASRRQIVRSTANGLRLMAVSGGARSLACGPIAQQRFGLGRVIYLQMETAKVDEEPAAAQLLANALADLSGETGVREGPVMFVGTSPALWDVAQRTGLKAEYIYRALAADDLKGLGGIVLVGGGQEVVDSQAALAEAIRQEIPITWHRPTPEAFAKLAETLGQKGLQVVTADSVPTLHAQDSWSNWLREDLTLTSPPRGWDRAITFRSGTVKSIVVPAGEAKPWITVAPSDLSHKIERTVSGPDGLTFDRNGPVSFSVTAPTDGFYPVKVATQHFPVGDSNPLVEVQVDGDKRDLLGVGTRPDVSTLVWMTKGTHRVSLVIQGLPTWGGGAKLRLGTVSVGAPMSYPDGVSVVHAPGAMVRWSTGDALVTIDGFAAEDDTENQVKADRYFGTLFQASEFPFLPIASRPVQGLSLAKFQIESGPYNEASGNGLVLRSNGSGVTNIYVGQDGTYAFTFNAESTPVGEEYCKFEVELDGKVVATVHANSLTPASFSGGKVALKAGKHALRIRLINDASSGKEDRNLTIHRIEIAAER